MKRSDATRKSNHHRIKLIRNLAGPALPIFAALGLPIHAQATDGVTFTDIAAGDGSGLSYRRAPSLRNAIFDELKQKGTYGLGDIPMTPAKPRGNPGVAIFDYDRDGDLDIYVTNGPGVANSLYANMLNDAGRLEFVDISVQAGVDALTQDSMGVCHGDIENDGDPDLYVLGNNEPNRLFQNNGDGTFQDITVESGTGGGERTSMGCSFGDVNGDGLLDLAVGNLYNNLDHRLPLTSFDYPELVEHNQLFLNKGHNVFNDASGQSGLENFRGATWSIAIVDYDGDGDGDIITGDDQGTRPPAVVGGEDHGYLRVYQNDSSGNFTDVTEDVGLNQFGNWMGLSFGDLNADGRLDIFATNIGDYIAAAVGPAVGLPTYPNAWSSRWFLGQEDGTFSDPGVGLLGTTPFGWGTSTADYDNDGDLDIIFHGGMDMGPFVDASNPGVILRNDGLGNFTADKTALSESSDHTRRNVQGMAVGDLNQDGFIDIVSVSNMDWGSGQPLVSYVDPTFPLGGVFDDSAYFWPTFNPIDPANPFLGFTWNGIEGADGTLSVEINSGDNGNRWVSVTLLGTKDLTSKGNVNRDGIGASVTFRSRGQLPVTKPVVSGGSHASADSLELIFGMARGKRGIIDVLWPTGVRNRLYNVHPNETITFPEIPCDFEDYDAQFKTYATCVIKSTNELVQRDILDQHEVQRLARSAFRAFQEHRSTGVDAKETRPD